MQIRINDVNERPVNITTSYYFYALCAFCLFLYNRRLREFNRGISFLEENLRFQKFVDKIQLYIFTTLADETNFHLIVLVKIRKYQRCDSRCTCKCPA